jgi:hypothetical protein
MKKASVKKIFAYLASLFLICSVGCTKPKEITGTWYWKSTTSDSDTEFHLIQTGNAVTGKHCSSFMSGSKLDCADSNGEDSITLNLVSENVYEGTIKSGFSEAIINVRLTLNPNDNTVYFKQLSQPSEEYYLPNHVFMTLAQP